jgi:hypothetical protein
MVESVLEDHLSLITIKSLDILALTIYQSEEMSINI